MAGLARARAHVKRLGHPKVGPQVEATVRAGRAKGKGIRKIAGELEDWRRNPNPSILIVRTAAAPLWKHPRSKACQVPDSLGVYLA